MVVVMVDVVVQHVVVVNVMVMRDVRRLRWRWELLLRLRLLGLQLLRPFARELWRLRVHIRHVRGWKQNSLDNGRHFDGCVRFSGLPKENVWFCCSSFFRVSFLCEKSGNGTEKGRK